MRIQSPVKLPVTLEGELVKQAVYNLNDMPNSSFENKTPNFIFSGTKLDLRKRILMVTGTVVLMLNHSHSTKKARVGGVLIAHNLSAQAFLI
jgi:hypothetical protein